MRCVARASKIKMGRNQIYMYVDEENKKKCRRKIYADGKFALCVQKMENVVVEMKVFLHLFDVAGY